MKKDAPQWLGLYEAQSEATAKADVGRYALLCLEGGLYADIDTECVRPISRMLGEHQASLFLQLYDRPWSLRGVQPVSYKRIANSIIASIPSHAIWSQVQATIERNPSSMFIPSRTGPTMLWPLAQHYAEANPHDVFVWDHRQILTAFYLPRRVMRFYGALRSTVCVLDFNDSGRDVLLRILHLPRQSHLREQHHVQGPG